MILVEKVGLRTLVGWKLGYSITVLTRKLQLSSHCGDGLSGLLSETQTLHLKPVSESVCLVRTRANVESYTEGCTGNSVKANIL